MAIFRQLGLKVVQTNRHLLQELVQMFRESLSDAYDQLNQLASSDTVHRLVRVLLRLGAALAGCGKTRSEAGRILNYAQSAPENSST